MPRTEKFRSPSRAPRTSAREIVTRAIRDHDNWVLEFDYTASNGKQTRRVVSPVRWTRDKSAFVALCLGRETCRTFTLASCVDLRLGKASDHVMPVRVEDL